MPALIRRSSLAAAIAATLTIGVAQAQARPATQFDLPAQPLSEAIREIARLTKVNILVDAPLVQGLEAPAIKVRATPDQVLKLLLEGSGLTPRYVDENTVTLQSVDEARATRPKSSAAKPEGSNGPFVLAQAGTTGSAPPASDERTNPSNLQDAIELEEIVVTGTHIRGVTSSASPTFSIQRDDFAKWGVTNVQDVLSKLPQNFGGASAHAASIASQRNGNDQNSNFGSGANLRGLGGSSTLVLLNGRRIAAGGLGAFVDVSAIPLSALERIDVIPDGASAIYGSDAVGGVINFILRDSFEGAETNVRYGGVTDGGLQQFDANQLLGAAWDTGAAFVTFDYQDRTNLEAGERGYANALARGPSDLIPEQRVWSVLVNGHQELGAALRLSAALYANNRDVEHIIFNPNDLTDSWTAVETEQVGGTLALDWNVSPDWKISFAHTYGQSDTDRRGTLTDTAGVVTSDVSTLYVLDTAVTEIIADGPLFAAPGGSARVAIGGEHRAESLDGERRGYMSVALAQPLAFERDVDALFAELNVPLVSALNARTLAQRLDLTAAVRHEEYSDFGSTTDPKLGIVYSPVTGLDLRGTYGTSFHAPYLNQFDDTFGVGVLYRAIDTGQITAAAFQAPGSDLGPEEASTWTVGFDVRPLALPGLEIKATYFEIEYEDRIAPATFTFTPATDPLTSPRLSSPPDAAVIDMLTFIRARDPYSIIDLTGIPNFALTDVQATLDGRLLNTAVTNMSGIDFLVSHSFTAAGQQLGAGINASYLLELENQVTNTSQPVDVVDTIFNPVDLRLRSFLTWSLGSWSAAAYVNYVDGYSDDQLPQTVRRVGSWTTCDLSAAYSPNKGRFTVRLSATNVFDRAPPTIIDRGAAYANPGYDTENADPRGRYVSVHVSLGW